MENGKRSEKTSKMPKLQHQSETDRNHEMMIQRAGVVGMKRRMATNLSRSATFVDPSMNSYCYCSCLLSNEGGGGGRRQWQQRRRRQRAWLTASSTDRQRHQQTQQQRAIFSSSQTPAMERKNDNRRHGGGVEDGGGGEGQILSIQDHLDKLHAIPLENIRNFCIIAHVVSVHFCVRVRGARSVSASTISI